MSTELDRRVFLKRLGLTAGAIFLPALPFRAELLAAPDPEDELLERLAGEPPAVSAVRVEGGAPRLHLNERRVLPRWGMSVELLETAGAYRKSGIDLLSPILGLDSGWTGPGRPDLRRGIASGTPRPPFRQSPRSTWTSVPRAVPPTRKASSGPKAIEMRCSPVWIAFRALPAVRS